MKKTISQLRTFLLIIVLSYFTVTAFSQKDFYPFPQTDAKWTILHTNMNDEDFLEIREYITGDTITIENNIYRLLIYSCLENKYYAYREENKKIFFYIPSIGEVLVYDFNLKVGDTIFYYINFYRDYNMGDFKCKSCDDLTTLSIDTSKYTHYKVVKAIDKAILADGSERKRYSLGFYDYIVDIWIEGVGSTGGPLYPIINIFTACGDVYHFTCLRENQEVIYHTPKCTDCLCGNTCEPVEDLVAEKCSNNCVLLTWSDPESSLSVEEYHIYRNDTLLLVTTDSTHMDENLPIGNYEYYVITHYTNDCVSDTSNKVAETIELGVKGVKELEGVRVYPNPTTGVLKVKTHCNASLQSVEVFDIYGRKCHVSRVTRHENIDISDLSSGIYFVKILTDSGAVVKKLVKL